ncbi:hypothetical protein BCV72DRAFT_318708 [Rhizopus microsporus var. microsporus]|uniref:Uncharacterized protein n=2 Tax=Rhizopus microsporus TaxID=58291 RepID=A0A2G4SK72_RHIZD|nr:uncharacterized protein RHIMIDRAFT_241020 [Rhizopus microsporus ATCC 52813]ORE02295.1 hypothetical protein BCV72DRAFT_318708 [Rhizopus microsporus var. microsporus]PHZ09142.1 hypothetical protein RHIMIDRAFT_241020 [Rhizopus microsporus ATCC 52813]
MVSSPLVSSPLTSPSLASESSSQPKPPQKCPPSSDLDSSALQKAAMPLQCQLRSHLRQLNINVRRILNIHYPDRHVVALLIHKDYEVGFRSQLKKFKIPVQDDYDPLDPSNLRDPDYNGWNEANRTRAACGLFLCRILHALDYLKDPVKQAVANFFANKGYIDSSEFLELFPVKKT